MTEQHSLQSLAARVGISRAAILGAIAANRLPVDETAQVGARKIYRLQTGAIDAFKTAIVSKLQTKISKLTADPDHRRELCARALHALKQETRVELARWDIQKMMDTFGTTREASSYLLNLYGKRLNEGGWEVSPAALAKIKSHIESTSGRGVVQ